MSLVSTVQVTQETTGQQVRPGLQCLAELMPRLLCFLSGHMMLEAAITQILAATTILSLTAQISESHYYLLNCKILTVGWLIRTHLCSMSVYRKSCRKNKRRFHYIFLPFQRGRQHSKDELFFPSLFRKHLIY